MRANPSERGKLITHGTWDHDFVERCGPRRRSRGSQGTLQRLRRNQSGATLRARGITTILLVGVNTNVCVEATLRDAYHREFFALMIPDATLQAGPDFIFQATVFNVTRFFGWAASADNVINALLSKPA